MLHCQKNLELIINLVQQTANKQKTPYFFPNQKMNTIIMLFQQCWQLKMQSQNNKQRKTRTN